MTVRIVTYDDTASVGSRLPTPVYDEIPGGSGLQPSGLSRPDWGTPSTLCANPPTVTHSTSATSGLTAFGYQSHGACWNGLGTNLITTLPGDTTARALTYVSGSGRVVNDVNGAGENVQAWEWETYFTGTTLEVKWNCTYNDFAYMQIFIDDEPTTAAPFAPTGAFGSTVSPTDYYTKLVFGNANPRKVRFRWENCAMKELRVDAKGSVSATKPSKPVIAFVGTSNLHYDGGGPAYEYTAIQACVWNIADALGMTCAQVAQSGSGYVSGNSFGGSRRINALAAINPDFIVVEGANNDNASSYATINAAAVSYYAALATLLPGTPVLVIGPMATDQNTDQSANRSRCAAAVRDAALAAPNVVAYVDPVGWWDSGGATPANYANSTGYTAGQIVRYQGGTYQCMTALTTSTAYPDLAYWKLISWLYGTGGTDYPNDTGNRDVLWQQTHGHSTLFGQRHFAQSILREAHRYLPLPSNDVVTLESGAIALPPTSDPSPSSGLQVYAKVISGRTMLKAMQPSGRDYPFQPSFFQNAIWMVAPNTTTSVSAVGGAVTTVGTISTVAPGTVGSTTFPFASNFVSAATANITCGTGMAATQVKFGGTAGLVGGFFFQARVGFPDASYASSGATTGVRFFTGVTSGTMAAIAGTSSPTGDFAGFHLVDDGSTIETTFRFATRNNTTTTRTDTGMAFVAQHVYDFYVFSKAGNTSEVWWRVDDITAGTSAEGSATATLPRSTIYLRAGAQLGTVNATARNLRIARLYCESDY